MEKHGLDGPVDEWRRLRDEVREQVLTRGYDEERGTFTQHYDTLEVDASLLVLASFGLVAGDDPRMLGTIRAVEEDLLRVTGWCCALPTDSGVDGSRATSTRSCLLVWLVEAYAEAGRIEDATALYDRLVGLANDVGLYAEEYDPGTGRMVGNFPQAFSHLTLTQAAFALARHAADA